MPRFGGASRNSNAAVAHRRQTPLLLLAVILVATGVAAAWVLRVPFMQGTDEQAHTDYAYALYNGGGWFHPVHAVPEDYATLEVQYLASISNFWQLRTFDDAKAPPGYGTRSFFERADRSAPPLSSLRESSIGRVPYVAFNYPIGYYELVASAMAFIAVLRPGAFVGTYFAGRGLGVLFLSVTLLTSYAAMRSAKVPARISLMLTAAVGFFPLTSWVSAYIQPDTLTLLCATLVLYSALRWRTEPFRVSRTAVLLLAIMATFFVKTQYAIALSAACTLMVIGHSAACSVSRQKRTVTFGAMIVLPLLAYLSANSATPIGHLRTPPALSAAFKGGADQSLSGTLENLGAASAVGIMELYLPGGAFKGFWSSFGDLPAPYLSAPRLRTATEGALAFLSLLILLLMTVRQLRVLHSLLHVARSHRSIAIRLLLGDIVLNIYVFWIALLVAVFAASVKQVYLEGRYCLPILLPTMLLGVCYVPRLLIAKRRGIAGLAIAFCWVAYSVTMAPVALFSMEKRFYGAESGAVPRRFVRIVTITRVDDSSGFGSTDVTLEKDAVLNVAGLAAATDHAVAVRSVSARLDEKLLLPVVLSNIRRYDGTSFLKFSVATPARLAKGRHTVRIDPVPFTAMQKADLFWITRE